MFSFIHKCKVPVSLLFHGFIISLPCNESQEFYSLVQFLAWKTSPEFQNTNNSLTPRF